MTDDNIDSFQFTNMIQRTVEVAEYGIARGIRSVENTTYN